ncbi:MAG TPA: PAS domain-containing protein [Streptosporangiaceae bacterium]|nr:PAS domain-containing protein [Streptosporangiaceae bacterium]
MGAPTWGLFSAGVVIAAVVLGCLIGLRDRPAAARYRTGAAWQSWGMGGPPAAPPPAAAGQSRDAESGADALVTSILDCVVQPVWVVDSGGLIRFANPSAVAALGYRGKRTPWSAFRSSQPPPGRPGPHRPESRSVGWRRSRHAPAE